ncbi:hypothetical protein HNR19_004378 [Nocardioides thalensis]|uniref:Peptidase M15C domain-containing protein n=1 Tax=Nocardioides thalensis TaxID=1914755 RepID=A0A853C6J7_9ACTN|nr:M15 family metallopeptidase [Nocardioides thalensis]NYJ03680.1 hypothetical protein [Nocardioides thalensis]
MGAAHRSARVAALAAVALISVACGGSEEPEHPDDPTNAAGSHGTTSSGVPEPSDRIRPTVEPPGPLGSPLYGDDLLVVSDETLPEDLVEQIQAVKIDGDKGVLASEQFSLGQVSLESKWYNIAAVDPETFRRFDLGAKTFPAQWERIAAGEISVPAVGAGRLPMDEEKYLPIGTGEQVQEIHVGALWEQQIGNVDMIVNEPWGEELGLPQGNALLIHTGSKAPQLVREAIQKFAPELSITDLDIVAETGIDPGTFQSVVPVGTYADAVGTFRYTPIGGGRVQPEAQWVREHIVTETVPLLGQLTCNKYMMPQLKAALAEVQRRGLGEEVYQTAGCYYPRFIAGTTTLSNHSFGLAIDINSLENQRGTVGQMHPEVVAIFKYWGFAWGGDWSYTDPMHFELREIVEPG